MDKRTESASEPKNHDASALSFSTSGTSRCTMLSKANPASTEQYFTVGGSLPQYVGYSDRSTGLDYIARVRAINSLGASEWSEDEIRSNNAEVPPRSPGPLHPVPF